jgi:UPF0716 protein FxsA
VFLLVLIFILVPIAELYVIIQVGEAIGLVPTLVLLIADAVLGSMLMRQQGRAAWMRFNRALAENRMPHKEVIDGVLVIMGGALLLTPGFITDIFGLVLLIPPTRALVRSLGVRFGFRRFLMGKRAATWTVGRMQGTRGGPPRGRAPNQGTRRPPPAPFDHDFGWDDAGDPRPRPDDIEGSGQEIRDEDELPPGREPFSG